MKNFNFQAMLKHGFLIIPKALLQQQIEDRHMQEGEIEALLKILMKVNYSDTLYNDRQNKPQYFLFQPTYKSGKTRRAA